jgi:hypothetical protein
LAVTLTDTVLNDKQGVKLDKKDFIFESFQYFLFLSYLVALKGLLFKEQKTDTVPFAL